MSKDFRKTNRLHKKRCPPDLLENFSPLKVGKIFPTNSSRDPLTLESFRPKKNTCLDYNLSETYLRWQVGDTKIRAAQFRADYVPAPPGYFSSKPKHANHYFHGGPPVWRFLDEIMREKIEKAQTNNRKAFKKFVKWRHAKKKKQFEDTHCLMTALSGPAWFQELSPAQLKIVDRLQECIQKDLKWNTLYNVRENIAQLGLSFRHQKPLELALKYCCGIDVEFLLILYQVSNPKRTSYSISDRLLLSAVVHLTLYETLKECHVRMPSPPRKDCNGCVCSPCKGIKQPKKDGCFPRRLPKIHYDSPYLVPYTFKPDPPKYSGIYENTHIQRPKSQYFNYLDHLRHEIKNAESVLEIDLSEIADPAEKDFLQEMQEAERLYNKLPHKYWKCLVRPTIKMRCMDFHNRPGRKRQLNLPPLCPLPDTLPPCTCKNQESSDSECCTYFKCECNKDSRNKCVCRDNTVKFLKEFCRRCQLKQIETCNNIVGGFINYNGEPVPIVQGIFKEKECECLQKFKTQLSAVSQGNKLSCSPEIYQIGGVVYTKSGPEYIISSVFTNEKIKEEIEREATENEETDICTCNQPKDRDLTQCFMDNFEKKAEEEEEPISDTPEMTMPWEMAECVCKKQLNAFLKEQCKCPDCLENTRPKNATYIVSGVSSRVDEEGNVENLVNISGVQQKRCDCLQKYLKHIKQLEEYRSRVKTRTLMKSQDTKFCIGGVTRSKLGPVYNIQGVQKPIACTCLEDHQKEEDERIKRMPEMPNTGRIKYGIFGVIAKEDKSVYGITHAIPVQQCSCENLFKEYQEKHKDCLMSYEEYRATTAEEIKNVEEQAAMYCQEDNEDENRNEELYEENMEIELRDEYLENSKDPMLHQYMYQPNESPMKMQSCQKCQKDPRKQPTGRQKRDTYILEKLKRDGKLMKEKDASQADETSDIYFSKSTGKNTKRTSLGLCQDKVKSRGYQSSKNGEECWSDNKETVTCTCLMSKEKKESYTCTCKQIEGKECSCQKDGKNNDRCSSRSEKELADCCYTDYDDVVTDPLHCSYLNIEQQYEEDFEQCICYDEEEEYEDLQQEEGEDEEEIEEEKVSENIQDAGSVDNGEQFQDTAFKRFFIFDKFPCKWNKQIHILKKLLKSLEMDGYPLAKLPECHKLPIFKLWMQLRCGKSWPQAEKTALNHVTKKYLLHVASCYTKIKAPQIRISSNKLNKYNWDNFESLRAMTSKLIFDYRRQIKQERINSAREYFPILFDYIFPFGTFRDCFFSYLPAKEGDIYVGNSIKNSESLLTKRDMKCFTYDNK